MSEAMRISAIMECVTFSLQKQLEKSCVGKDKSCLTQLCELALSVYFFFKNFSSNPRIVKRTTKMSEVDIVLSTLHVYYSHSLVEGFETLANKEQVALVCRAALLLFYVSISDLNLMKSQIAAVNKMSKPNQNVLVLCVNELHNALEKELDKNSFWAFFTADTDDIKLNNINQAEDLGKQLKIYCASSYIFPEPLKGMVKKYQKVTQYFEYQSFKIKVDSSDRSSMEDEIAFLKSQVEMYRKTLDATSKESDEYKTKLEKMQNLYKESKNLAETNKKHNDCVSELHEQISLLKKENENLTASLASVSASQQENPNQPVLLNHIKYLQNQMDAIFDSKQHQTNNLYNIYVKKEQIRDQLLDVYKTRLQLLSQKYSELSSQVQALKPVALETPHPAAQWVPESSSDEAQKNTNSSSEHSSLSERVKHLCIENKALRMLVVPHLQKCLLDPPNDPIHQ